MRRSSRRRRLAALFERSQRRNLGLWKGASCPGPLAESAAPGRAQCAGGEHRQREHHRSHVLRAEIMHERRRHRCYRHTSSVRAMPPYEDRGCTAVLRRGVSSQGSARHAHSRRARTAAAPLRPVVEEVCRAYAPLISAPAAPAPNATTRHPPVQEHRAHTGTVNRKRSVVVRMHQACEGRDHSPQIHCRVRRAALPPDLSTAGAWWHGLHSGALSWMRPPQGPPHRRTTATPLQVHRSWSLYA